MTESERRGEGFLARWSERKRAVRESEAAEEEAAARQADAPAEEDDGEEALAANRAAAEAIDLDSLAVGSDMSAFFKPGVPALLKQAALRKLWRCDPVFAVQDGLDIYRENFNDPSYLLTRGSSWVPGSGYAQRLAELKEQAKQALAEAEARAGEATPEEAAEVAEAPDEAADLGREGEAQEPSDSDPPQPTDEAESAESAEEATDEAPNGEEGEPAPRVPLRTRLDFAAFKDEG